MWYFLIFPVIFVLWRAYRFGGVWQIISSLAYIVVSGGISIGIFKTVMKQNLLKKKKKLIAYVVFAVLADQHYKGNNISVSAGHKSYWKSTAYTNGIKSGAVSII